MRQWTDTDPEEEGLLKDHEESFGALRRRRGSCPEPALLTAAQAGVLPEHLAAGVAGHLRCCPWCRVLAHDLADPDLAAPTAPEAARIRATVFEKGADATPRASRARWMGWWRPATVLGSLAVALAVGWWIVGGRPSSSDVSAPRPVATPQIPRLALEKPPVIVPLASVLVWRNGSQSAQDQYLADLGTALAPYRADDFSEAVRRLDAVAQAHPTAEVRFYRGVCRLFLAQPDLAIADLLQARQLASPVLAQEATWYLAVAYERAGRREAAVVELRALCGEKGERQGKACEAVAGFETIRR
jgi:hypothetical protein